MASDEHLCCVVDMAGAHEELVDVKAVVACDVCVTQERVLLCCVCL